MRKEKAGKREEYYLALGRGYSWPPTCFGERRLELKRGEYVRRISGSVTNQGWVESPLLGQANLSREQVE
jgi:hypothetical protein